MRELRGKERKPLKKKWRIPHFLLRHRNQKWCKNGTDWASSDVKIEIYLDGNFFYIFDYYSFVEKFNSFHS